LFSEWWTLVTDPKDILSEWRAIAQAWEGAAEFQGESPMANPAADGLAFHTRLLDEERVRYCGKIE
jgi:hypothetical protein